MTKYDSAPDSLAEKLISTVFAGREREADPVIARLRLERALAMQPVRRPLVRNTIKVAAFLLGLVLLGSWASGLSVQAWDDGQQITLQLPAEFTPGAYPFWVAIFANNARSLSEQGGHSLVVDYFQGRDSSYYLQLGLLGIDYSKANEWLRQVMTAVPELHGIPYAITQPLVPYRVTIGDMLAYRLGDGNDEERSVVQAWAAAGQYPTSTSFIYLIARPKDYQKRVSVLDY